MLEVAEDFYKIDLITKRFEAWKSLSLSSYNNAYILLSLPKLFSPLIRIELIDWNPLEVYFKSLNKKIECQIFIQNFTQRKTQTNI